MGETRIEPMRRLASLSTAELRAVATQNLAECCDKCLALLREQLDDEEHRGE